VEEEERSGATSSDPPEVASQEVAKKSGQPGKIKNIQIELK
jgi:hypothetical protein